MSEISIDEPVYESATRSTITARKSEFPRENGDDRSRKDFTYKRESLEMEYINVKWSTVAAICSVCNTEIRST